MSDPVESPKKSVSVYSIKRRERKLTIKVPSKSVKAGKTFKVTGKLTEDGRGLGGKTVNLYIEGSREASTTTGSDGSYSFDVSIPSRGTYSLYTEAEVSSRVRYRRKARGGIHGCDDKKCQ